MKRPFQARDIVRIEGETGQGFRRIIYIQDGMATTETCVPNGITEAPNYRTVPVADLIDDREAWDRARKAN